MPQEHVRLPSLTVLRAFEATVRLGSVSAAAHELHFTHGAVSRHVRSLEDLVGRRLLERRNRGVHPTPDARRLADEIAEALDALHGALRRAGHPHGRTLVLSCEPTLLMRWLIPRLPRLAVAAPDVTCQLVAAGGPVAFAREGVDLALRRDDFEIGPELHVADLAQEVTGPVCAPRLAEQAASPERLTALTLLDAGTRPDAWDGWAARAGVDLGGARRQRFEHFYLTLQAAAAGVGVAIASELMARDDLASGQLVAPYGFSPDGSRYVLLSPEPLAGPGEAVLAWLRDAIAA